MAKEKKENRGLFSNRDGGKLREHPEKSPAKSSFLVLTKTCGEIGLKKKSK